MDIKGKHSKETAPTPNNTPRTAAPIQQGGSKKGGKGEAQPNPQDLQAQIASAIQNSEIDDLPNPLDLLPIPIRRRLRALENLQDQHAILEAKFREELLALEAKYLGLYDPLYKKRSGIVSGKAEPTDDDVAKDGVLEEELKLKLVIEDDKEEEVKGGKGKGGKGKGGKGGQAAASPKSKPAPKQPEIKGIPQFWLVALKNHPLIMETIFEYDEEPLEHLEDVRMTYGEDNLSFTFEFHFAPNPYFTNQVLTKTYFIQNVVDSGYDDFIFVRAEGSTIDWKQGKDLTVRVEEKKQKNKASKKTRVIKKIVPQESFFRFFSPLTPPEDDEEEPEEDEEGEEPGLSIRDKIDMDFEIGEVLKQKIVPHAIDWYTGKALEYEEEYGDDDYMDGEEEEEEEPEDGEEEEEEPEEDDDDEGEKPVAPKPGEKPAECAQQ